MAFDGKGKLESNNDRGFPASFPAGFITMSQTIAPTRRFVLAAPLAFAGALAAFSSSIPARGDVIWVEGEKAVRSTMHPHGWYDSIKQGELSEGGYVSNFHEKEPGLAWYVVTAPKSGAYEFWVRANPIAARLSYKINDTDWAEIEMAKGQEGMVNLAADDKIDLRFVAWVKVGFVPLKKGANAVRFRMDSKNNNHGSLDCFVFSEEPFLPNGILHPDQIKAASAKEDRADREWFAFNPAPDRYSSKSAIDLPR